MGCASLTPLICLPASFSFQWNEAMLPVRQKRIMDNQLPVPTSRARPWPGKLNENVKGRPDVWTAHRGLKLDPC